MFVVGCFWCVGFVLMFCLCVFFLHVSFSDCVRLYMRAICCVRVSSLLLFFVCLVV